MPRRSTYIALTVLGALVAIAPASASSGRHEGVRGHISIQQQTFAGTQFGTPTGNPTLVTTDPLEIPLTEGESFRTSTIRCDAGPAPYNDVGLVFTPGFPRLPDPAPIRSFVTGTVTEAMPGDRGSISGTITSFLCESGQATDQITVTYTGRYGPSSETQLVLRGGRLTTTGGIAIDGRFRIIAGSGRFADMRGGGSIWMQLTCLPSTLTRNGAKSCADLGAYSEAIPLLEGRFKVPTVPAS